MDEFETVHVVHDFIAENEDEIPLKKGDSVLVIEKDEEFRDGWWRGRNVHGEIGLFPMNYVSKTPPVLSSLERKIGTLEDTLSAMQLGGDNIGNNGQQLLSDPIATNSTQPSNAIAAPPPPATTTTTTPSSSKSQRSSTNSNNSNTTTATSTTTNTTNRVGSVSKPNLQRAIAASLAIPALHDTSPEEWTIEQVASWLDAVGFKDMIDPFKDQEITGDVLLELTQQSLKELGIVTFGKRYKVHSAIQALKQEVSRRDFLQQQQKQALSSDAINTNHQQQTEKPVGQQHHRNGSFDDNSSVYNGGGGSVISTTTSPSGGGSRNMFMAYPPSSSMWSSQNPEFERRGSNNVSSSATTSHNGMHRFNRAPSISAPLGNHRPRVSTNIPRSSTEYDFRQPTSPSSSYASYAQSSSFSSIVKEGPSADQIKSIRSSQQQNNRPSFLRGSFLGGGNSGSGGNSASSIFSLGGGGSGSGRKSVDLVAKRKTLAGEDGKPDMEGWLHKQGDRYKTWNKRWFVLRGPNLFYFKSPKDLRVKGIINLVGYSIIPDETIHSGKYCFKMQHENERTFYFYTSSKESLKSWMRALMKVTISRNYAEPVLSSSSIATVSLEMARRMRPRPPSIIMEINEDGMGQQPRRSTSESRAFSSLMMGSGGSTQSPPPPPPPVMRQSRSENIMSSSSSSTSSLRRPPMQPVARYNHPFTTEEPVFLSQNTGDSIDTFGRSLQRETSNNTNHAHLSTVYDVPDEDDEDLIDPQQDHITKLESSDDLHRHKENEYYIRWVNDNMSSSNEEHRYEPIQSLAQMKSGEPLIGLLEGLSRKPVRRQASSDKSNTPSMKALDTIVAAFRFMGREGITVDGSFTIKDVFGGDEAKIMVMLETIKEWADGMNTDAHKQ